MKIVSFNVKNFMHGKELLQVARLLKQLDADIVGLQEVDREVARSERVDQPREIARLAGYPYYAFGKNIDYQGGDYGNLILSRYPIRSEETVFYKAVASKDHNRSYLRCELDLGEKTLWFYNTHLTLQENGEAEEEVREVTARMSGDPLAVLVGDFNLPAETVAALAEPQFRVLNGGEGLAVHKTFPMGAPEISIDNMIVSPALFSQGIEVYRGSLSDHDLIFAEIEV